MADPMTSLLFLLHLASTLFMAGVIWFVQVVHYPLFARTAATEFPAYELTHTRLTTFVVAPPMLAELASALLLLWMRPASVSKLQCGIGVALLSVIWLSTFALQVPAHNSLSAGFDPAVHRKLLSTNWLRTAAWTLRGILVLWMAWPMVR